MTALRITASIMDILFSVIVAYFMDGLDWKKDRASLIGFGAMEICFVVNLICVNWR